MLLKGDSKIDDSQRKMLVQYRGMGGLVMKKFLLASVAFAAIAGPAMAADMPVAPPPPPVVYYDWTGAYIGFNAGSTWSHVDRTFPNPLLLGGTGREVGITSRPAPARASSASTPARSGSGAPGFWARKLH